LAGFSALYLSRHETTILLLALALPSVLPARACARRHGRKRGFFALPRTPPAAYRRPPGRFRLGDASFISDFTAKEPVEGAAPRSATRVAFVYDDDALYVGARMEGSDQETFPSL